MEVVVPRNMRLKVFAKVAGISSRQVLRIEELGVLGEVPRGNGGHRRFDIGHLRKLWAASDKVRAHLGEDFPVREEETSVSNYLPISAVAKLTGFHQRTLTRLEAEGRIPKAERDATGRRIWTQQSMRALRAALMSEERPQPPWIKPVKAKKSSSGPAKKKRRK